MRRREFLAGGSTLLSVAVAGCGHPPVVLDMDSATAEDISNQVSITVDPGSEEFRLVRSAIENGSATRKGRSELFYDYRTVRFEGAFYDVSETQLGRNEVTVYELLVDFDPADATPEIGEVRFDALPEADQRRLGPIFSEESRPTQDGYDMGIGYGTAEEVGNESVFVPEREYDIVVHEGNRYQVAVDSRTATESEYRYTVTEVAADVETFADKVREQYLFTLEGLSDDERRVVEAAIDNGYFQEDEAFRSVVDRLRAHEAIELHDFYGTWLLEYERIEYLVYAEW